MVIQEPVQAAIWQALNHYAYSDAVFLAERLYAEVGSDDALFLLATCYYRSGKAVKAYTLLKNKGSNTAQCRYLLARCCADINKLSEAETALSGNILTKTKTPEDIINEYGESASYALSLLANIYSKTERISKSIDNYKKSLSLNPFLWSSFERLCNLGEKPDPTKIFHVSDPHHGVSSLQSPVPHVTVAPPSNITQQKPQLQQQREPVTTPMTGANIDNLGTPPSQMAHLPPPQTLTQQVTPENFMNQELSSQVTPTNTYIMIPPSAPKSTRNVMKKSDLVGRSMLGGSASLSPLTPSFGVLPLEATPQTPGTPENMPIFSLAQSMIETSQPGDIKAPSKKPMTRRGQQTVPPKPPVFSQSGTNTTNTKDTQISVSQSGLQGSNIPNVRRSSRLFSNANSVKENNKTQGRTKFTSPKTPARKSKTRSSKTQQEMNELNRAELSPETKMSISAVHAQVMSMQKQSTDGLMSLLQHVGRAYLSLSQYDCHKAIEQFHDLPVHHFNTGWVLSQVGRSYFEMHEYQKAEKVFAELRLLEPQYMEGMEIYSTTLWHLSKEVQLSALAQELTQMDKNTPEAWIATGNCFSLQKEHDIAIKFFQRAIQVDPNFAYGYTLLGHEYGITEELDKAMACFRNAIRVNPRHYNAWYGVGMIYFKQGKFALAEVHFRKALSVNPNSSVLLCHVGVAQFHQERSESAIATLNKAIAADPKNALCKFNKASILFTNDRHKEALKELEELKEIVPKESLVYFLIGKVHKKLGNTHLALMNFSWAMDLDPKGANNRIKEAIDKHYVTDVDEGTTEVNESAAEAPDLESPQRASSNNSSIMEGDDVQLQAIESDESL